MVATPRSLPASADPAGQGLERLVRYFEELTPADLDRLGTIYCEDALFKDPFNEVRGLAAIHGVFTHMFATVQTPQFRVTGTIPGQQEAMVAWEFHCRLGRSGQPLCLRGVSHLEFAPDGRVSRHRDYWDTAEELYMKVPLLGWLMRLLRRLLAAPNNS
jgi:steroid delta-isomerase